VKRCVGTPVLYCLVQLGASWTRWPHNEGHHASAAVCAAQKANAAAGAQQYTVAEGLFLKAKRPEAALAMYRTTGQWQAALRIAESYLPGRVQVHWGEKAPHRLHLHLYHVINTVLITINGVK
jgi:hypothetical protein